MNLIEILDHYNQLLAITESQMRKSSPQGIASTRKKLRDGAFRAQTINKLKRLGVLLMSKYEIKPSDRFFVPLEEEANQSDRLKEKSDK